jgi:hypothetical protein
VSSRIAATRIEQGLMANETFAVSFSEKRAGKRLMGAHYHSVTLIGCR